MRTQVCIIGGGPSGLLLSQLLHRSGIDTVVLEARSRAYVAGRIRAGLLEWGSVETLRAAGVGARMDRDGIPDDGVVLASQHGDFRIDIKALTGKRMMIYGQTEITADLFSARDAMNGVIIDEVEGVRPHGLDTGAPHVTYSKGGTSYRIDCDWVIGCDGYHGVSRTCIPSDTLKTFERIYPFGWLGVLSETPPVSRKIVYANHPRGFALCSLRNEMLSRYYVQVPADDAVVGWSDDAFWDELRRRLPDSLSDGIVTGPSIEKSIAPLRSFVAEPMRWGRLCLAGDAAHIVPPTGAKGLNLAISDVSYLHDALVAHFGGDDAGIDGYSARALNRVWKAIRFSWWFTSTMHRFPDQNDFDQRIQDSELAYLEASAAAQTVLAEQYVGLPY